MGFAFMGALILGILISRSINGSPMTTILSVLLTWLGIRIGIHLYNKKAN